MVGAWRQPARDRRAGDRFLGAASHVGRCRPTRSWSQVSTFIVAICARNAPLSLSDRARGPCGGFYIKLTVAFIAPVLAVHRIACRGALALRARKSVIAGAVGALGLVPALLLRAKFGSDQGPPVKIILMHGMRHSSDCPTGPKRDCCTATKQLLSR